MHSLRLLVVVAGSQLKRLASGRDDVPESGDSTRVKGVVAKCALGRAHAFAFARVVFNSDRRSAARASSTHKHCPERVRNSLASLFAFARIDSALTSSVGLEAFTNTAQNMRRWQYSYTQAH